MAFYYYYLVSNLSFLLAMGHFRVSTKPAFGRQNAGQVRVIAISLPALGYL